MVINFQSASVFGSLSYLINIEEAIKRIIDYTYGMNNDDLIDHLETQDAVPRNIEIIGETGKYIYSILKDEHPEVEFQWWNGKIYY